MATIGSFRIVWIDGTKFWINTIPWSVSIGVFMAKQISETGVGVGGTGVGKELVGAKSLSCKKPENKIS